MSLLDACLLVLSATLAAVMNSVAGGGSFITFPTLLFTGVSPIEANATNTIALWPASAASAVAYREKLNFSRKDFIWLGIPSLVGGILGSWLLILTPESTFLKLLPFLLLFATTVFARGPRMSALWPTSLPGWVPPLLPLALLQLVIATYGGYFGGGMGLMMLAAMSLLGMTDIHRMNGLKNVLAVFINSLAVGTFVVTGKVLWPQACVMLAGSLTGGYAGARLAQRIKPLWVRRFVMAVGFGLTAIFFLKYWT